MSPAQLSPHPFTVTILERPDHRWLQGGACSSMQAALLNGEGGWDVVGAGERWKTDLEAHEAVTKVRFR